MKKTLCLLLAVVMVVGLFAGCGSSSSSGSSSSGSSDAAPAAAAPAASTDAGSDSGISQHPITRSTIRSIILVVISPLA